MSYIECENPNETLAFFGMHKSAKETEVLTTFNECGTYNVLNTVLSTPRGRYIISPFYKREH